MQHDLAVRTIVGLLPDIEKRGAEKVLTDYAEREELPAAQLEKLAQVYNTLLTVDHIDRASADDRGASVSLLDVPNLVVSYVTGAGHEKVAAGTHSFASHDVRSIDLRRAVLVDAGLKKSASFETTVEPSSVSAAFNNTVGLDQLQDAVIHIEVDLMDEMSKLACELFAAAPISPSSHFSRDISEFEEEALYYQSADVVKSAGDYMEKFAKPHRTNLTRFDYANKPKPRAYDIEHEMGQKFAELAKKAAVLEMVKQMSATLENAVASQDDVRAAGASPDSGVSMADLSALFGADMPVVDTPPPAQTEAAPKANDLLQSMEAQGLGSAPTRQTPAPSAAPAAGNTGGGSGGKPPKSSDSKSESGAAKEQKDGGVTKAQILAALSAPFRALGGGLRGAADKANSTLAGITGKERYNKAQKTTDVSVDDIRRSMQLRRLMGTDSVLREANPKDVLEAYNSVVRRNPELAGDMAALRLVLREAVSYEGLTLDSQKLLTEIRRNSEQADELANNNDRRRYSAGGSNLLPIKR